MQTNTVPVNVRTVERFLLEYADGSWWEYDKFGSPYEVPGLGRVDVIAEYGGEGQGDEMWTVFKIGNRYFRIDGYYSSYGGSDWDGDLREVTPVERTVTFYE